MFSFKGNYYLIFLKHFFKLFLYKGFEEIIVIAESITTGTLQHDFWNVDVWLSK